MNDVSVWKGGDPDKPEPWPTDPRWAAARLTPVILEMEARGYEDREALLGDLLRTAWPTVWAQDQ